MPQTFHSVPIIEIASAGTQYNWGDINVSAYVPVGATGVVLHVDRGATGAVRDYGIRRNGNIDNRNGSAGIGSSHAWAIVGIDANRIFEFYNVALSNRCALNLLGYTTLGVDFTPSYTNAPDISPAAGAWNPVNLGPGGLGLIPVTAVGVIIEVYDLTPPDNYGLQNNGSTDARILRSFGEHGSFTFVIGCAGQIVELYRATVGVRFYLHAFITEGATFFVNAVDVTPPAPVGAWQTYIAMPLNSVMGFLEISSPAAQRYSATRPTGGIPDYLVSDIGNSAFPFCELDGQIRGRMENAATVFFMPGYAHTTPPLVQTSPATEIT